MYKILRLKNFPYLYIKRPSKEMSNFKPLERSTICHKTQSNCITIYDQEAVKI